MKTCNFLLLLSTASLCGQDDDYALDWSSITGGGQTPGPGTGEFSLESTLGQAAAADASGGPAEFSLSGGYWNFVLNEPLDLSLAMQLNGGTVTLTWDDSTGVPVQLESSLDLQLWQPVNPQPLHPPFLEVTGASRHFYRLMPLP